MHPTLALLQRHTDELQPDHCVFLDSPDNSVFNDIKRYDLRYHPDNKLSLQSGNIEVAAMNVLFYPKAKERLFWWLAQLAPRLGAHNRLWIVGENDSGIKSLTKRLNGLASVEKVDSARHCVLFEVKLIGPTIENQFWTTYTLDNLEVHALPGVFSAHKLDFGSRILLPYLDKLKGKALEMGCGAGVLSAYLLAKNPNLTLTTYDADLLAVRSTLRTLEHNSLLDRASVHWADDLSQLTENQYDVVVTNPPFHKGVHTSYVETESFFKSVQKQLKPGGQMIWVANDFLNYHDAIRPIFKSVVECVSSNGFRVFKAIK